MKIILIPIIVASAVAAVFLIKKEKYEILLVKIGKAQIEAEHADTAAKRTKGLMYRKNLEENTGMFFTFPNESKHTFWMANTKIPLDIIWINSNFEIIYIYKNAQPCIKTGRLRSLCASYSPEGLAKYVLEVNAGWIEKNKIKVGDLVQLIDR